MSKNTKDLDEILHIYESKLCNRIFKYQLNHKTDIEIVFYKENFCHLLGLQHIYGKDKRYLGSKGYDKIKNGLLKRNNLIKHNKAAYNRIKIKLDHFDEISNMMIEGEFIKFYQYRTYPLSIIVADFIIFQNNKEYLLHLFLRQENEKTSQYAPTSFIVISDNDKNRNQFIAGQEHKKVTKMDILEQDIKE